MPIEDIIKQMEQPPVEEEKKPFWGSDESVLLLDMLGSGLAPENPFAGIGTALVGREQEMKGTKAAEASKRMTDLMDAYKAKAAIRASTAASALSEYKLGELKKPTEMIEIGDTEGGKFEIPKEDMLEGMKYLDAVKRNRELNLLTQEQTGAFEKKIPIKVGDKEYEVSPVHYASIAKATEERKKEETRTKALEKYRGKSLDELSDMDIADFAVLGGTGGIAALANRISLAGNTIGLSDAHYRHYASLHVNLSDNVMRLNNPDDALISTVNNLSQKLRTSHMMLKVPVTGISIGALLRNTKAVTVPLPPNVNANMVYEEAEKRGISVSEILQTIYDRSRGKNE
jgi:hypothetical protein